MSTILTITILISVLVILGPVILLAYMRRNATCQMSTPLYKRAAAKLFDLFFYSFLAVVILPNNLSDEKSIVFLIIIVAEAVGLYFWGTTVGKKVFGVKLPIAQSKRTGIKGFMILLWEAYCSNYLTIPLFIPFLLIRLRRNNKDEFFWRR